MKAQKTDRILYLDALRVLACFFVVLLHAASQRMLDVPVTSAEWNAMNIYDSLSRWGVPVFVMISGALLLDPRRKMDLRRFYTKNLVRIAAAFLFWSAGYAVLDYLDGIRLRTVAFNFITGHIHLWYLYMIAGLYLIVPLLRKLTESKRLTAFFLALWFLFSVLLPTFRFFVSLYGDLYARWVDVVSDYIGLHFVVGYSGYFILGHFLCTQEIKKSGRILLYILGVLGVTATAVLARLISLKRGYMDTTFYDFFFIGVMVPSIALFVLMKQLAPVFEKKAFCRCLSTLSKCSFGIYLVHIFFIRIGFQFFGFGERFVPPALYIPVVAVIVFLLSLLSSYILNKIPFVNRYLV
ncbi:MAG: acyltransferase family protein [Clostridia bacterium]|nr:acyltransferase family protein [Clostridia bacterium]